MRFYDCSTAPSPRRVRIFIAEKGVQLETVEVDLRNREQMSEGFRRVNPHCTVPVLELDDGLCLTTTAGIRAWLETQHPAPNLMGETAYARGLIADLCWRIEAEGFVAVAEAWRNNAPAMMGRALAGPQDYDQIPALAERGRQRVRRFLDAIDAMIGGKNFVAGDRFSVADIDLLVLVDFAAWLKLGLPEGADNARRWYAEVSARDSAKL